MEIALSQVWNLSVVWVVLIGMLLGILVTLLYVSMRHTKSSRFYTRNKALKHLYRRFKRGEISEKDYHQQKAEVIQEHL